MANTYQSRKLGTDWKDCKSEGEYPITELKDLLDHRPYIEIKLTNPSDPSTFIEWRVKPRDEDLIEQIRDTLVYTSHMFDMARANAIYDILEDRGLV